MADIEAKDLLDRLDNYHQEIVALAQTTTSSIHDLKEAVDLVKASRTKWYVEFKWPLVLLALFIVITSLVGVMHLSNICEINFNPEGQSGFIQRCGK